MTTMTPRLMSTFDTEKPAAWELRGRAVFKAMDEHGIIDLVEVTNGTLEVGRGIFFVDGGNLNAAPMLQAAQVYQPQTVIVDIHFPFMLPDKIQALQTDTGKNGRSEQLDEEAREFWSRPETQAKCIALMEGADVVTCPWPGWARGLEQYNANVVVVPDVVDLASARLFFRTWAEALRIATHGRRRLRSRLAGRYLSWLLSPNIKNHLKAIEP